MIKVEVFEFGFTPGKLAGKGVYPTQKLEDRLNQIGEANIISISPLPMYNAANKITSFQVPGFVIIYKA